jgi:hypothetical protein
VQVIDGGSDGNPGTGGTVFAWGGVFVP